MSELDKIIAPEITSDEFSQLLTKLIAEEELATVLEIGASSGEGSTEAIYKGVLQSGRPINVYSLEVSAARFTALQARYEKASQMHSIHASSVKLTDFPTEQEVTDFYNTHPTNLNHYPLKLILEWRKQDIDYIKENAVPETGIDLAKQEAGVEVFDLVLIDGSEFTGAAELKQVHGAKFILLDDVVAFKNHHNHVRLENDPLYDLLISDFKLRHGFSVFKRKDVVLQGKDHHQLLIKVEPPKKPVRKTFWKKLLSRVKPG